MARALMMTTRCVYSGAKSLIIFSRSRNQKVSETPHHIHCPEHFGAEMNKQNIREEFGNRNGIVLLQRHFGTVVEANLKYSNATASKTVLKSS